MIEKISIFVYIYTKSDTEDFWTVILSKKHHIQMREAHLGYVISSRIRMYNDAFIYMMMEPCQYVYDIKIQRAIYSWKIEYKRRNSRNKITFSRKRKTKTT